MLKLEVLKEALEDPRLREDAFVYVERMRNGQRQALASAEVDENGDLRLS